MHCTITMIKLNDLASEKGVSNLYRLVGYNSTVLHLRSWFHSKYSCNVNSLTTQLCICIFGTMYVLCPNFQHHNQLKLTICSSLKTMLFCLSVHLLMHKIFIWCSGAFWTRHIVYFDYFFKSTWFKQSYCIA